MIRIVSPFRPFAPESAAHRKLGPFDWHQAYLWMAESARRHHVCDVRILTDAKTWPDVQAFRYATAETRLMLWILDVSLAYLQSDDFDVDTVFVSPDTLIQRPLSGGFKADLGVIVRPGYAYAARPILNAVQWWRVDAKAALIVFYERVLGLARSLPEPILRWGADSEPLRQLLAPIVCGYSRRAGVDVYAHDQHHWMTSLPPRTMEAFDRDEVPNLLQTPVVDFKGRRKHYMGRYAEALRAVA